MSRNRMWRALALFAVSAVALGFVASLQVRSQALAQRNLASQNPTDLALLIDNLNQGRVSLLQQTFALTAQRDALSKALAAGESDSEVLQQELNTLRAVNGELPVQGTGVIMTISGRLTAVDLQDQVNALLAAGAEAVDLNGHRMVQGVVVTGSGGLVKVGGEGIDSPYVVTAIGDQEALAAAAALIEGPLKASSRVDSVAFVVRDDVVITSVRQARVFYYAQPT